MVYKIITKNHFNKWCRMLKTQGQLENLLVLSEKKKKKEYSS